jgi:hypothetical protein
MKFYITEEEKRQILESYGAINEYGVPSSDEKRSYMMLLSKMIDNLIDRGHFTPEDLMDSIGTYLKKKESREEDKGWRYPQMT